MYQSTIRTCTKGDCLLWCLGSHWDWSVPSTQWELPSSSRGNIETEINQNVEWNLHNGTRIFENNPTLVSLSFELAPSPLRLHALVGFLPAMQRERLTEIRKVDTYTGCYSSWGGGEVGANYDDGGKSVWPFSIYFCVFSCADTSVKLSLESHHMNCKLPRMHTQRCRENLLLFEFLHNFKKILPNLKLIKALAPCRGS